MLPFLSPSAPLPFAARYGSPLAPARWANWRREDQPAQIHLTAPDSGLRLTAAWRDFPRHDAVEWQLTLANTGRYLSRGIIAAPINRLDDETFESLVPCSLCLGWIADAPELCPSSSAIELRG
jgi:hypothetical protein